MKIMKNSMKCFIALFVMALALSVTGITAQAATKTKKLTLYVGEKVEYTYIGIGSLKSVKSSKSKVVSAKKKSGHSVMQAKKAGKATVTVKGTRGTFKYNITVKKPSFSVSIQSLQNEYALVNVKNNTSGFFDSVDVILTLKDANGNPIAQKTVFINYLGSKKTALDKLYYGSYDNVDISKTTYSVSFSRNLNATYKNYDSKVKWNSYQQDGKVYVTVSTSYKGSGSIYAGYNVVFYDAIGNVINCSYDTYDFLYKNKKVNTTEFYVPDGAVSYTIINKRAILRTY